MDENKGFLIIDEYINSICRKIMSPRKKNEVYDELYSHLIEEYEKNVSLGLDDESAQLKAIEKMGDKKKLPVISARYIQLFQLNICVHL